MVKITPARLPLVNVPLLSFVARTLSLFFHIIYSNDEFPTHTSPSNHQQRSAAAITVRIGLLRRLENWILLIQSVATNTQSLHRF